MARKKRVKGERKFESIKDRLEPIKKEKMTKVVALDEKKRVEFIKESEKRFPLLYALLIFFVVAVIGGVLIFMTPSSPVNIGPVKEGDIVQIGYTGRLQDGTVFNSGNHTFVVGTGEVISGIDRAVTGMIIGEGKTVTIPPEEAYGDYDQENVRVLPLVQELSRMANITEEMFKLTFDEGPIVDRLYSIRGMDWLIRVIDIQNQTVVYRQEAEEGEVFDLVDLVGNIYGTYSVSVENEKIVRALNPTKGSTVMTAEGLGRITEVNETHMVMDFNDELAGETLTFEIKLINFLSY